MKDFATYEKLVASFRNRSVFPDLNSPHRLLLPGSVAREFLLAGKKLGFYFLGVDGHVCINGAYHEHPRWSNDIASTGESEVEFENSTNALLQLGEAEGIVFEIVFDVEFPPFTCAN